MTREAQRELHRRGLAEGRTIDGRAFDAAHYVQTHEGRSTKQTDETLELGGPLATTDEDREAAAAADPPAASTGDTSPPAADDAPPPAEPEPEPGPAEPAEPTGRLKIGTETKGRYVVMYARKPGSRETARARYVEVCCLPANSPEHAKRLVMGDRCDPHDEAIAAFLRHSAAQKPGILLRAVPAMHWPDTVEVTSFWQPPAVLKIG